MDLTLDKLIGSGVSPTQARIFLEPIRASLSLFDLGTPVRTAAFLSQAMVESDGFRHLEENLYYTSPERIRAVFPTRVTSLAQAQTLVRNPVSLANTVYANRLGNGDVASGDGWRHRGRGVFMTTGKNNYADAANELGRPYLEQPDLVGQPSDAVLTAAWYFHAHKCHLLADASNIDAITKAVNGPAMLKAMERRWIFDQAMRVLV